MIDLDSVQKEFLPVWALEGHFNQILRGILYTGLDPQLCCKLLTNKHTTLQFIRCAMGSRLFFGRDDAPFVPFDLDYIDENENKAVKDRQWPWCWGDEIWTLSTYENQPLMIHFEKDGCSLFLTRPEENLLESLNRWMTNRVDLNLLQPLSPSHFLRSASTLEV